MIFVSRCLGSTMCSIQRERERERERESFLLRISFSASELRILCVPPPFLTGVQSPLPSTLQFAEPLRASSGFPFPPLHTPRLPLPSALAVLVYVRWPCTLASHAASRFEVFSAWGSRLGWSSSPEPCLSQQEASFSLDSSI